MTVQPSPRPERRLLQENLPWVVGAGALVVYLVTLNHWVGLSGLALVSRINGWEWQPMTSQPLLFLVTLPFRCLPASWVPLALNLFTALCASLTLVTLARSVALLPQDRTEHQRQLVQSPQGVLSLPNGWVPVVLGAAALGLQLTFWENAIAASGEMLDVLLFAYVIRCVLEHRVDQRQSWLDRAALLFGVALANSWGMALFLPLVAVAVVGVKRRGFFSLRGLQRLDRTNWEGAAPAAKADLRAMGRLALLGLAGLSLFLLLPVVQAFSPGAGGGLWAALRAAATSYWDTNYLMARIFFRYHREITVLLASGSLVPVLLLCIRWGTFGGSERGERFDLGALILHLSHGFLLLICVAVVFDPPFSPRQIARQNGLPLPFLPLYYLTALSVGYYSGFFLLLFGPGARQRLSRRRVLRQALWRAVPVAVYVVAGLAVAGLLVENVPAIRAVRAPYLDHYARLAAGSLPPEGAAVLSDDPLRLNAVLAALAREGRAGRYVPVETRSLPVAAYRAWLRRKYPALGLAAGIELKLPGVRTAAGDTETLLDGPRLVQWVSNAAQTHRLYCLQPIAGVLFEQFYLQPHGLLHEMTVYPAELISDPLLGAGALAENRGFWQAAIEAEVRPLLRLSAQGQLPRPAMEQALMKKARLQTPPPVQARLMAGWYSAALNRWGVALQRNGRASEAAPYFALAQDLNAENLPARVNGQCNSNLVAHQPMTVDHSQLFQEQFGKFRDWTQAYLGDGPFDEPNYCYRMGVGLAGGGMLRQACQQFERVKALAPGDLPARLALGDLFITGQVPVRTLELAAEIRADPALQPLGLTNEVEVALLEAKAWLVLTNRPRAQGIIYALLATHASDGFVLDRAVATLAAYQCYADALRIVNRRLEVAPNDAALLAYQGNLRVMSGDFSNAIPPLTLSLSLTNSYVARLNRAIAYVRVGQAEAANADYTMLLQASGNPYMACLGVIDAALKQRDTNAAIRYGEQYLAKAGGDSEEAKLVASRLETLGQRVR